MTTISRKSILQNYNIEPYKLVEQLFMLNRIINYKFNINVNKDADPCLLSEKLYNSLIEHLKNIIERRPETYWGRTYEFTVNMKFNNNIFDTLRIIDNRQGSYWTHSFNRQQYGYGHLMVSYLDENNETTAGLLLCSFYNPVYKMKVPLEFIADLKTANFHFYERLLVTVGYFCKRTGIININTDEQFLQAFGKYNNKHNDKDSVIECQQYLKIGAKMSDRHFKKYIADDKFLKYSIEKKIWDEFKKLIVIAKTMNINDFIAPEFISGAFQHNKIIHNFRFSWTLHDKHPLYVSSNNWKYMSEPFFLCNLVKHTDKKLKYFNASNFSDLNNIMYAFIKINELFHSKSFGNLIKKSIRCNQTTEQLLTSL